MNIDETKQVLAAFGLNYRRDTTAEVAIWAPNLADVPFDVAREAAGELIRTAPYLPNVAEFRERARLIKAARDRKAGQARQIEARTWQPSRTPRTGPDMVRHVLGRLADAGQDVRNGQFLGAQRAGDIAEAACDEWLARTAS